MASVVIYPFVKTESSPDIEALNTYMRTCSYLNGPNPTKDDYYVAQMITFTFSKQDYPHAARWYEHISYFSSHTIKSWPNGKMRAPAKKSPEAPATPQQQNTNQSKDKMVKENSEPEVASADKKAAVADDDDEFDVFGEETEEDAEEARKMKEKKAAEKEQKNEKKGKEKRIDKSSLVIEIKPYDGEVDLEKVKDMIWSLEIEGLTWGEAFRKVPLAYGLYKLQVNCTIIDEKVDTDGIVESIEILGMNEQAAKEYIAKREAGTLEDDDDDEYNDDEEANTTGRLVQSAEIISFNKL